MIESLLSKNKSFEFFLFSDGTDEELGVLLEIPQIKRVFFGNALADMFAISRCRMVVASDSTFSAWGAFLGEVPIVFSKRHFPPVYKNLPEYVLGNSVELPQELIDTLII